jgi:hypothetical protein
MGSRITGVAKIIVLGAIWYAGAAIGIFATLWIATQLFLILLVQLDWLFSLF